MYQYYNAHPKDLLVGDCVKRAIAKAAERDYKEVSLELNRYKKITHSQKFNDNKNVVAYLINILKATKMSFPAQAGRKRMNGERFCQSYPKGHYILSMAGHLAACVDGVIYDTWDCSDKCVYVAWRLPDPQKTLEQITGDLPAGELIIIRERNKQGHLNEYRRINKESRLLIDNLGANKPVKDSWKDGNYCTIIII